MAKRNKKKSKEKTRNPHATVLREKVFQNKIIPNKDKTKPDINEDWE